MHNGTAIPIDEQGDLLDRKLGLVLDEAVQVPFKYVFDSKGWFRTKRRGNLSLLADHGNLQIELA
jgi:hypothetical protein